MRLVRRYWLDAVVLALATIVFVVPFGLIFLTAVKDRAQAARLDLSWPTSWHVGDNISEVVAARVNPLYFLPGSENATVQLTLYNFQGQYSTQWNLLFTDILLVTIPPLVMFMAFNRKIVSGLTVGALRG